jgi:putative adenylate-forming enzyme
MIFKIQIIFYLLRIKIGRYFYEKNLFSIEGKRKKRLRNNLTSSPFYKDLIKEDFNLNNFPIIEKNTFMSNFDKINTLSLKLDECMEIAIKSEETRDFSPMIKNVAIGLSTGTSGNRGLFLVSSKERAIWVAGILDRVIGFSFKKRKVAFFLRANNNLYQATQSKLLQFTFFDIFQSFEIHLQNLNKLNPTIIVGQPSVLCLIAKAVEKQEITISPQKIISVAEVLTDEDRMYLEKIFSQKIHQVYQCTEGFLGATCKYGTIHFNEDFIHIEKKFIDKERLKFHPIITDYLRSSQPVVRYELNDIIIEKKNCPCGSKMMAIEKIEGRSDEILKFINNNQECVELFPDLFRKTIVLSDEKIQDYCLVQTEPKKLSLYIKSENIESFNCSKRAIEKVLSEKNIIDVLVEQEFKNPFEMGIKKRRIRNAIYQPN